MSNQQQMDDLDALLKQLRDMKKQYDKYMRVLIAVVIISGILGYFTQSALCIIPIICTFIAYSILRLSFACPKCGTPYLYEIKGFTSIPKSFPSQCRNCGLSTKC